jgi:hypothetical protein
MTDTKLHIGTEPAPRGELAGPAARKGPNEVSTGTKDGQQQA